jgi:hypothetical protein
MKDLFNNEVIRTLGLYQPYATLMLHGKIESRWVKRGKKPPFPLGEYLIYSTKKQYKFDEFTKMAGYDLATKARELFFKDVCNINITHSQHLNGFAIGVGELFEVCKMPATWLDDAYYWPPVDQIDPNVEGEISIDGYTLWALRFKDVKRIKPFPFKGKQGTGFLKANDKAKIEYV